MEPYVELRPHIGRKDTPIGPVNIEHDQWIAVLHSYELTLEGRPNGCQIGYLPKREGAKLLWDPYMRERFQGESIAAVEAMVQAAREAM